MRISLAILSTIAGVATLVAIADPLPPDASYRPLPTVPLDVVRRNDEAAKPAVMRRQQSLLSKLGRGINANIPKELDPEHQSVRAKLEKASGKDFDIAYLGSMVQDHQRTANLLQWQISNGQNEALKKYAADTLPDVMEHLEMAKQQYAMLTSGAPPVK